MLEARKRWDWSTFPLNSGRLQNAVLWSKNSPAVNPFHSSRALAIPRKRWHPLSIMLTSAELLRSYKSRQKDGRAITPVTTTTAPELWTKGEVLGLRIFSTVCSSRGMRNINISLMIYDQKRQETDSSRTAVYLFERKGQKICKPAILVRAPTRDAKLLSRARRL